MDEFLLRTFNLLRLERDAEKQKNELSVASQLHSVKTLEDKGLCIQKLHVNTNSSAAHCILSASKTMKRLER